MSSKKLYKIAIYFVALRKIILAVSANTSRIIFLALLIHHRFYKAFFSRLKKIADYFFCLSATGLLSLLTLFLISPNTIYAGVFINEIMYDLPESDQGREWIEISNLGTTTLNLEGWNIETTANHKPFILLSGSFDLAPNQFALIIQNFDEFSKDWPGFSGNVYKSTFNLRNDSATIVLKDGENIVDSLTYNFNWGAKGEGSSLQKFSIEWVGAVPTPGKVNLKLSVPVVVSPPAKILSDLNKADIIETQSVKEEKEKKAEEVVVSIEEEKAYNTTLRDSSSGYEANVLSGKLDEDQGNSIKWILATLGLIFIASILIFISPKKGLKDPADDIKIIE